MDFFETFHGVTTGAFWASLLAFFLYRRELQRGEGRWWAWLIVTGLLARLAFALLHLRIGLSFYGGFVDFMGYHVSAISAGEGYLGKPLESLGELFGKSLLRQLLGLLYLLTGPSIIGMFLVSGLLAFLGSYLFLRAFQIEFPDAAHSRFLALGLFFLPSFCYWSSVLGKDSWIIFLMGLTTYSCVRLLRGFSVGYALTAFVSIVAIALIRGPVGVITVLALGITVCFGGKRTGPEAFLWPIRVGGVATAMAGLAVGVSQFLVGHVLSLESYLESAVTVHTAMATDFTAAGRSNLPPVVIEPTIGGLLRYLPEGIFTYLFRPVIFEAHHALALVAALDGTLLLALILWRRRSLATSIKMVFARPFIGYCLAMLLLLSAGLGFERNLGALARHRAMALPFLLILLAVPPQAKRRRRVLRESVHDAPSQQR